MKFDPTITFALILGITSIISPIIVTIINNHYQLKIKRFDNLELAKRQAIIDFINVTAECTLADSDTLLEKIINFQKVSNQLILFFPNIDTSVFDEILKTFKNPKITDKDKLIRPLIIKLAKQLTEI